MVRRIGKLLICMTAVIMAEPSVHMELLDADGDIATEIARGITYTLRVTVESDAQIKSDLKIQGIEQFDMAQRGSTSTQMNLINGAMTHKKTIDYQVMTIATSDKLTLGPVAIAGAQAPAQEFAVVEPHEIQQSERNFVRIEVPDRTYYVGERIPIVIEFLYQDKIVAAQLPLPSAQKLRFMQSGKEMQATTSHGGKSYGVVSWPYEAVAQSAGQLLIPSLPLDYQAVIRLQQATAFNLLTQFFGDRVEQRRAFTAPVTVAVQSLPIKQPVDGVGTLRAIELAVKQSQVVVGEPINVTMKIAGDLPLFAIDLKLQGLADGCTWYESKSSVQTDGSTPIKTVEFIVQTEQPGSLLIPEQTVRVFNPITRALEECSTKPVQVQVLPLTARVQKSAYAAPSITLLNLSYNPKLLVLIGLILNILVICMVLVRQFADRLRLLYKQLIARAAFMRLRVRLYRCNTIELAYVFCQQFVAQRAAMSVNDVTGDDISAHLTQHIGAERAQRLVTLLLTDQFSAEHGSHLTQMRELLHRPQRWWIVILALGSCVCASVQSADIEQLAQARAMQIMAPDAATFDVAKQVLAQAGVEFSAGAHTRLVTLYGYLLHWMPFALWQILTLCIIIGSAYLYSFRNIRWARLLTLASLAFWCMISLLHLPRYKSGTQYAIVQSQTNMYAGPDASYGTLAICEHPCESRVIDYGSAWSKIVVGDRKGWVESNRLASIKLD